MFLVIIVFQSLIQTLHVPVKYPVASYYIDDEKTRSMF